MAGVREQKYLAFMLGDQEFASNIAVVREIRGLEKVAAIPDSPPHLIGMMDLRGKVIPVVDLRRRFHLPPVEAGSQGQVIIVVEMDAQVVGLLVDRVTEVLSLADSAWEPPPPLYQGPAQRFLSGVANLKGRLIVLLDLTRVLSREEVQDMTDLMAS